MKFKPTVQRVLWGVCLFFMLTISGCGGSDSSTSTTNTSTNTGTGVFLDSAVEGISYISGSVSGVTDANGAFTYEVGSVVRFMIGDVVIGEAPGQSVVTPVDLVSGSNASHPTVINIVSFLLTLDEDGNPDNGIQISEMVRSLAQGKSIDFTQATSAFAADGNVQTVVSEFTAVTVAGARTLVTESYAQTHLSGTIWGIYAGSYTGTFSGDDSGSLSVTILSDGSVTGTGAFDSVGAFTVSGQLVTNGVLVFAMDGALTDASFIGTIDLDGGITGSWKNAGATGAFTGQRSNTGSSGDAGNQDSIVLTGDIPSYITGSYTPSSATKLSTTISWSSGWENYLSDGYWSLSIAFASDTEFIEQISFQWTGYVGSTVESIVYSCVIWSSDNDCNNASIDIINRRVIFTSVALQDIVGGTPSATLNGTLKY